MGPALSGLALGLDAAESLLDADLATARQILARTRAEANRAVIEVRRIIDDLRPDALDEDGLAGALQAYTQLVSARGQLAVELDTAGLNRSGGHDAVSIIDPEVEVAAYRIAQEAITNAIRHSGASHCTVRLSCGDAVTIEVRDNGTGIRNGNADGVGLASIRERAESCGGTLVLDSSAAGTCLSVSLPRQRQRMRQS
jgi:two-component system NarL family sensor kinase